MTSSRQMSPPRISFHGALVMLALLSLPIGRAPVQTQLVQTDQTSDWGAAPPADFIVLTRIEIRNDTVTVRKGEVAYSGVPIAKSLGLLNTDGLAIVSPDGRRIAAQFDVLGRWAGGPNDTSKPIEWVQVALKTNVAPNSIASYELRKYGRPVEGSNDSDARILSAGGFYRVTTGEATFVLDPASPAVIQSIARGATPVYEHMPGAGPRVIDSTGVRLTPRVDDRGFAVEERGPVKIVVRSRGHFARGTSSCLQDLGYIVRLTFERASSDVGIEYQIINECGNGYNASGSLPNGATWWNQVYQVNEVSWNFPILLSPDHKSFGGGSDDAIYEAPAGGTGLTLVEQERGGPGAVYRKARLSRGTESLESAELFRKPFVAAGDRNATAMIQMPWMRYREPQALAASKNELAIRFISRPSTIGEAQGIWNVARLAIFDGGRTTHEIQEARDQRIAALERGLLIHVPVTYLDSTKVMPPMAGSATASARTQYVAALDQVHADTISPGGQWDRKKVYGFTIWPDYSGNEATPTTPAGADPQSNYWSATSTEFRQWFVDGNPKWVWDFALPQEYTQLVTNYYNLGSRNNIARDNYRGGYTPVSGSSGTEGEAFRSGWGSDDYTYDQGSDEAYLIRPSRLFTDRFADAADTFIRRYGPTNIPVAEQQHRDVDLQALVIGRGVAQHVNLLRYAAQFAPANNGAYVEKITSVMNEYVADNLKGGIFCQADYGNEQACVGTWGIFHFVSLQLGTFLDYLYWVGEDDPRGAAIKRAVVITAGQYYRRLMNPSRDGSIDPQGAWKGELRCTFRDNGATLVDCEGVETEEPVYRHERASGLSFLLLAHALRPDPPLCVAAAAALSRAVSTSLDYLKDGTGWNKGAAQSAHQIIHGLAIAESCGVNSAQR